MLDVPYISVIILSWNRKPYIKRAVDSVLNQTLTPELIEIIVTKNYYDQDIDYFLKVNNVRSIYLPIDEVGTKIADAIDIARGTVICFLDDDDTFKRDKLNYVCDMFTSDNDIGYIHDSVNLIREDDSIIMNRLLIGAKNPRLLLKPEDKNDSLFKRIIKDIHDGPASAIGIRREILMRFLEPLRRLKLSFDSFSLIVSLNSGYSMLFSELVLLPFGMINAYND
jgi:glycosyltransferase involved in cell wall biosynthesis